VESDCERVTNGHMRDWRGVEASRRLLFILLLYYGEIAGQEQRAVVNDQVKETIMRGEDQAIRSLLSTNVT